MAQNWSKPVDVELETLIRARYPIIYVVSWEERRVEETLREVCQKRGKKMIQWTITSGLGGNVASRDPLAALDQVLAAPDQTVFLLKDFHPFMNDHMVVRKLRDLVYTLKTSYKTLVLLSPMLKLPIELEKEITVVDYQLPTPGDIDRLLEGIIQSVRSNNQIDVALTPLEREQVLKAASGLTSNEAENVFAKSLVEKRKFDIDVILSEKEQIIRKSGILEYYPASEAFSDVGGMDLLKEWMSQRTASFTDKAREYGLPEPKGVLLLGVQGCGKCFEKNTPVLMHDGTVKMVQDVCVGDQVMGPDSQPREVLSTTTGRDELFRVTPTKGRPYTVNADHILTLRLSGARKTHKEAIGPENIINITVRDYLTRSAGFKQRAMGYRAAVDFPAQSVLIDPYFLGVWLGDGTTKGPSVTTADPEIADIVTATAEHYGLNVRRAEKTNRPNQAATYHLTAGNQGRTVNPLLDALREVGVLGNKHIPLVYKANSREVRLRLLAGIIDTDGCMAGNDFEIIQKREQLANDIAFVARSLGLAAYVTPSIKSCKMLGMTYSDTYYRVHISGHTDMIPVLLHRKQAQPRQQCKNVLNVGIMVQSAGVGDYYGFMVSGDHRFLLDDFTVVHNSLTAKAISSLWKLPLLRLDVGKIFGGIVGQSEENIRKAISTAESVAPCVTGDTRITLWGGAEKTIQELYEGQETELTVQGMDNKLQAVPVRVKAITRREAPDLFTIKMRHATLQATSNHQHPVLRDGKLSWVRTDALKSGDFVAIPREVPTRSDSPAMLEFLPDETRFYAPGALELAHAKAQTHQRRYAAVHRDADYVRREEVALLPAWSIMTRFAIGHGGTSDSTLTKLPEYLNEELGYVLGLIHSDGYLSARRVGFVNTDRALHQRFCQILSHEFGVTVSTRLSEAKESDLPGTSENSVFRPCFVSYTDSKLLAEIFRAIENQLLSLPKAFLQAYLRGYFDGDGCVSDSTTGANPKITLTCKVTEANRRLRSVLLRAGFPTTNPSCCNIELTGWHTVQKFITEIGSEHPCRRGRMEAWQTRAEPIEVKDRTDVIPVGSLLREIRQSAGMGSNHFESASPSLIHYYETSKGNPGRAKLRIIMEELKAKSIEATAPLECLVESNTGWSQILSVEPAGTPEFVYDLCCDKIHNFVANNTYTHNCILWIDELEKGFSGTQSSGSSDGGTTSRVFGTFLAWMQDKKAPVFVVATSNDVTSLPPELLRKGRFDEIFFVDLPSKAERKDIFDIHLKKRGRDPKNFDTERLGKFAVGFSGAEIEQVVVSALFAAFADRNKNATTGEETIREVTVEDVMQAVKISVPLSVTMQESIDHLRSWAEDRARPVSSVQSESAAEILEAEENEDSDSSPYRMDNTDDEAH